MQQNNVLSHLTPWQQGNKHKLTANQIAHLLFCLKVPGLPDKWWRNNFCEGHTPEMVSGGAGGGWGKAREEGKETEYRQSRVGSHMATLGHFDWWRYAGSQAGKTRKCNSGRLSGYDISGSYSICSQTLKWRLAWHGGREVTTVSSLPVNPTTPSEENKIVLKRRRRGQETGKKIKQKKCIYILTME